MSSASTAAAGVQTPTPPLRVRSSILLRSNLGGSFSSLTKTKVKLRRTVERQRHERDAVNWGKHVRETNW